MSFGMFISNMYPMAHLSLVSFGTWYVYLKMYPMAHPRRWALVCLSKKYTPWLPLTDELGYDYLEHAPYGSPSQMSLGIFIVTIFQEIVLMRSMYIL